MKKFISSSYKMPTTFHNPSYVCYLFRSGPNKCPTNIPIQLAHGAPPRPITVSYIETNNGANLQYQALTPEVSYFTPESTPITSSSMRWNIYKQWKKRKIFALKKNWSLIMKNSKRNHYWYLMMKTSTMMMSMLQNIGRQPYSIQLHKTTTY